MKSLHLCNLANVAYGYCKILRHSGHVADLLCHDLKHLMSQPEWDDLELDSADFPDENDFFNNTADFGDYRRPDWFTAEDLAGGHRGFGKLARAVLPRWAKNWLRPYYYRALDWRGRPRCRDASPTGATTHTTDGWDHVCEALTDESRRHGPQWHLRKPALKAYQRHAEWVRRHAAGHDVAFAYVLSPIYAMLCHELPYITVEIGTMRDIPFEGTEVGKLMALAYRQADHVLITNPDCQKAAQRLGITSYSFCPHPLDESVYGPADGESPLRRQLISEHQATSILFAPARQNWDIKGNDKYLRAFAELLRHKPKALLIVPAWGQEVERSKRLCAQLGAQERTLWLAPLSERWLTKYYQAADLVLDQFNLGVFGLITPKAMACGKPVLTSYEESLHRWCFPEHPPVVRCSSEKESFEAMLRLSHSPQRQAEIGTPARAWVLRHYARKRIIDSLIEAMARAKERFEARKC